MQTADFNSLFKFNLLAGTYVTKIKQNNNDICLKAILTEQECHLLSNVMYKSAPAPV